MVPILPPPDDLPAPTRPLSVPRQLRRRLASIPLRWVITIPLGVSALGTLAGAGYHP